jgi:hypothetical protein
MIGYPLLSMVPTMSTSDLIFANLVRILGTKARALSPKAKESADYFFKNDGLPSYVTHFLV